MFPPVHRFWPSYLVTILTFIVLFCLGFKIFNAKPDSDPTVLIVYIGVWVAFISILSSSWSQWRSSSVQHAMSALQTLRTDREYLINMYVLRKEIPNFSTPLTEKQAERFFKNDEQSSVDNPSFTDASSFVLNQYEFLAAAARQGAVDQDLLQETIAGSLSGLVETYAPVILKIRTSTDKNEDRKSENVFKNIVWLYREQNPNKKINLGP